MTITPVDVSEERRSTELACRRSVAVEPMRPEPEDPSESASDKLAGRVGVALFYGVLFGITCWNIWRVVASIGR